MRPPGGGGGRGGLEGILLKLVDESVAAFFPAFFEIVHRVRVAMR